MKAAESDPARSPLIHFAQRSDADESVEPGPALCDGSTQQVTAIFDDATCSACIAAVRADVAAESDPTPQFTTSIAANGSKWAGQEPDSLDVLIETLRTNTLDPVFERYGNFIYESERTPGFTSFWGNFFEVSAVFDIDTNDPAVIETLTTAIRANQSTPAYAAAQRARKEQTR